MPTPHIDFHYVPTSGPIPGKSVLDQTERAVNELGGVINEVSTSAQQGIDIANTALTTATDALGTAQGALDAANSAADGVEEVRQLAHNAQSSADIANQAAQTAQSTADTALEASGAAASRAGDAVTVADEAHTTAQKALDTANSADSTARQALAIAESNTDSYEVEIEAVDLDNYTEAGDKIYATSVEVLNAPVAPPLFLRVGVSSDDLHVTQECWSEEKPERKYSRSGVVSLVEGEEGEEEDETVVTWSEWGDIGDVLPVATPATATEDGGAGILSLAADSDISSRDKAATPAGIAAQYPVTTTGEANKIVKTDAGGRIRLSAAPSNALDAATKQYVDGKSGALIPSSSYWLALNGTSSVTLPAGGTWAYFVFRLSSGVTYDPTAAVAAGGTVITIAGASRTYGLCWRIK